MSFFCLFVALLAQDFAPRKSEFEGRLRSPDIKARLDALSDLGRETAPGALELVAQAAEDAFQKEAVIEREIAAMLKLEKDKQDQDRLTERGKQLEAERKFRERAVRTAGELAGKVPGPDVERIATKLVGRIKSPSEGARRVLLADLLGELRTDPARETLVALAKKTDSESTLRIALIDALARFRDPEAAAGIIASMGDQRWQVRAAAMEALGRTKERTGIPALIGAVLKEQGRLQEDAAAALRKITAQDFGRNAALWNQWWQQESARAANPPPPPPAAGAPPGAPPAVGGGGGGHAAPSPPSAPPRGGRSTFYGLEILSTRVAFVLDRSGSMLEPASTSQTGPGSGRRKIEIAKEELKKTITALPPDARFTLIVFGDDVEAWEMKLVKADAGTKDVAIGFALSMEAKGQTNIFDALKLAFDIAGQGAHDKYYQPAIDTIFLLSDGSPNRGTISDPGAILAEIRRINRLQRLKINCVGVGGHNAAR
jgi:HEAT repeat protein